MSIFNLVLSAVMIVGTPILITQVLGMSDTMYGFTQGALALGGLCGGILTAIVSEKLRIQNSYVLLFVCSVAVAIMGSSLFLNIARHRIVLGNHFHELYRYGSFYALYGSDLHTGTDADPTSISR